MESIQKKNITHPGQNCWSVREIFLSLQFFLIFFKFLLDLLIIIRWSLKSLYSNIWTNLKDWHYCFAFSPMYTLEAMSFARITILELADAWYVFEWFDYGSKFLSFQTILDILSLFSLQIKISKMGKSCMLVWLSVSLW